MNIPNILFTLSSKKSSLITVKVPTIIIPTNIPILKMPLQDEPKTHHLERRARHRGLWSQDVGQRQKGTKVHQAVL